jgi:hypothetical protein
VGLKLRNGFSDRDLAAAVGVTLAASDCEDCGLKVGTGLETQSKSLDASRLQGRGRGVRGPWAGDS